MPVILQRERWEAWLDPDNNDVDALQALLVPAPVQDLAMFRVSTHVNNARHKDARCAAPLDAEDAALIRGRDLG